MPQQKGFANITNIVVLVVLLAVIGVTVFYFKNVSDISGKQASDPAAGSSQNEASKKPTTAPLSKEKERDFQRMIDIKQLQAALKMYHDTCNGYPPMPRIAIFGSPLLDGAFNAGCPNGTSFGTISAAINGTIPVNPQPGGVNYQYCSEAVPGSGKCGMPAGGKKAEGYIITFVLEGQVDTLVAGAHIATPKGIK